MRARAAGEINYHLGQSLRIVPHLLSARIGIADEIGRYHLNAQLCQLIDVILDRLYLRASVAPL